MSMNLPFIKCTKCGKSTLEDEYYLSGCPNCGDNTHGVEYQSYKRRDQLAEFEGVNVFVGRFRKVGNLHYRTTKSFVLVENIRCGTEGVLTSHAYITDVSPNTLKLLKDTPAGTNIQFKARVHQYTDGSKKWGFNNMCHLVSLSCQDQS